MTSYDFFDRMRFRSLYACEKIDRKVLLDDTTDDLEVVQEGFFIPPWSADVGQISHDAVTNFRQFPRRDDPQRSRCAGPFSIPIPPPREQQYDYIPPVPIPWEERQAAGGEGVEELVSPDLGDFCAASG